MHITRFSIFLNYVVQISNPERNPDFETVPLGLGICATCKMATPKWLNHGGVYRNKAMQTNILLLNFTIATKT